MFGFTKKIIAAFCLLALYPGQHEASCSSHILDDGAQNSRSNQKPVIMHQSFEKSTISKTPTMNGNGIDIKKLVLIKASKEVDPSILRLVCKDWRDVIDSGTPNDEELKYRTIGPVWKQCIHAWYGVLGHEDTWQTILNGELVYKPNPDNDEGIILLKISGLHNPFAESFDLSRCGEAYKYLDISMGLRKGKKDSNKDKSEIRLIPRFLAVHKLENSASYLKGTIAQWSVDVPVAVIFNWWSNANSAYAFCYWAGYVVLAKNNLRAIYFDVKTARWDAWGMGGCGAISCFVFKLT